MQIIGIFQYKKIVKIQRDITGTSVNIIEASVEVITGSPRSNQKIAIARCILSIINDVLQCSTKKNPLLFH